MLINPFIPSEIASLPEEFFGRSEELEMLERAIAKGSIAIHGPVGIGKSSLLARLGLLVEGFGSAHQSDVVVAVADRSVATLDDAARLVLERFVEVDESQSKIQLRLGNVVSMESSEVCKYFAQGRHLAALKRIIEEEHLRHKELLVLAVDEADKAPRPLAQLFRSISTHVQLEGIKSIRFLLAGLSPFLAEMIEEDAGVNRFVYKAIRLQALSEAEASELIETKLGIVVEAASAEGVLLEVDPSVVEHVVRLSGGHPHLLQLLGSHLVEHEEQDPDGVFDARDLVNSLTTICYEDRAAAYEGTLHLLEVNGMVEAFRSLMEGATSKCPTRIDRRWAIENVDKGPLEWLLEHDVLTIASADEYGLADEFLWVRLVMDSAAQEAALMEGHILDLGTRALTSMEYEEDTVDDEEELLW